MKELLTTISEWFEKVPDYTRAHRGWVWTSFILLTLLVGFGSVNFKIDQTLDAYFQEDDPMKQDMERFRTLFGSDEVAYLIYRAKDGDVFSENSLRAVKGIQDELQNYRFQLEEGASSPLDHITDVKSLINASYMESRESALISRNFIGDNLPTTQEEREHLRQLAQSHPDYKLFYLSENSEYGGIMIRTDFGATLKEENDPIDDFWLITFFKSLTSESTEQPSSLEDLDDIESFEIDEFADDEFDVSSDDIEVVQVGRTEGAPEFKPAEIADYSAFMHELNKILEQPKYLEHLEYHPVGNPPIMTFFADVIMAEMGMITIASLALIMICLLALFRSFSAVIWPLLIIVVTLVWVIGLVGWTGTTMTFMVNIIVFLTLAVGVADTVHILSGYLFFRNQGMAHEPALRSVFKKSGLACLMTSITTAIAMLSLMLVPIEPIKDFGIFSAIGVFLAFIFTVFVLPVMLDLWSPFSKKRAKAITNQGEKLHLVQALLRKLEPYSYKYPLPVFVGFLVLAGVLLYGAKDVKIDSNLVNIIKEGQPIRETYEIVDEFMSGTGNMEILVKTETDDGLKDPRVLKAMEDLQVYMKQTFPHLITRTSSLVEVTKDSFKALNEGDPDKYIIPEDPGILANTLFMFNNANPKDRRRLVTDDYSMGRITVSVHNAGSMEYTAMIKNVETYAETSFGDLKTDYPRLSVKVTGSLALMMQLTEYISWSQVRSFGLALLVISIMLLLIFGSKRIGLIAILPNVFPILSIFGIMGYFGIELDTDTLLVAPITIGIAVDDTIHFLTHYRIEVVKHGRIKEAVIHTFREAGQAISFTSIILSAGFLIFLLSTHQGLSYVGIMSAIAFMSAWLADLFLLPAMCILFKARFGVKEKPELPTSTVAA